MLLRFCQRLLIILSDRKLATVRKIKEIHPIPDADMIERAVIDGWNVVIKKGEFKPGDHCIYFEIDSLLPDLPQFEFLRKSSWNANLKKYRLKTVKLKGVVSQGLALPLSGFVAAKGLPEGTDLTEDIGVEKYEPPVPTSLGGDVKGHFPSFIPKTDEERIQNIPNILMRHQDTEFVITEKLDGTSSTFYCKDGVFGFCGRNWEFKPETQNTYSEIAKKYNLEDGLQSMNLAVQGEIVGPGIQGNKYNLSEHKLFLFHAYDIDRHKYLDHDDFIHLCDILGVKSVPVLDITTLDNTITVEKLIEIADGDSKLYSTKREGIVIKSRVEKIDAEIGRLSFKVINNKFLMKHGD